MLRILQILPCSLEGLSNSECQIEPTIGQVGAILGFLEVIASAPSFGVPDRRSLLLLVGCIWRQVERFSQDRVGDSKEVAILRALIRQPFEALLVQVSKVVCMQILSWSLNT